MPLARRGAALDAARDGGGGPRRRRRGLDGLARRRARPASGSAWLVGEGAARASEGRLRSVGAGGGGDGVVDGRRLGRPRRRRRAARARRRRGSPRGWPPRRRHRSAAAGASGGRGAVPPLAGDRRRLVAGGGPQPRSVVGPGSRRCVGRRGVPAARSARSAPACRCAGRPSPASRRSSRSASAGSGLPAAAGRRPPSVGCRAGAEPLGGLLPVPLVAGLAGLVAEEVGRPRLRRSVSQAGLVGRPLGAPGGAVRVDRVGPAVHACRLQGSVAGRGDATGAAASCGNVAKEELRGSRTPGCGLPAIRAYSKGVRTERVRALWQPPDKWTGRRGDDLRPART